jgi:hypothetical protein
MLRIYHYLTCDFLHIAIATRHLMRACKIWELKSIGKSRAPITAVIKYRRQASQRLASQPAKRECIEMEAQAEAEAIGKAVDRALIGLQRIYQDPNAKPRSEGQASQPTTQSAADHCATHEQRQAGTVLFRGGYT